MPTKLQGRGALRGIEDTVSARSVLRPRTRGDAVIEHSEALLRADETFIRMVLWAAAGIAAAGFAFIFHWIFVFVALLFGAAWVAAADTRRIQLKCAENWQKYLDTMDDDKL